MVGANQFCTCKIFSLVELPRRKVCVTACAPHPTSRPGQTISFARFYLITFIYIPKRNIDMAFQIAAASRPFPPRKMVFFVIANSLQKLADKNWWLSIKRNLTLSYCQIPWCLLLGKVPVSVEMATNCLKGLLPAPRQRPSHFRHTARELQAIIETDKTWYGDRNGPLLWTGLSWEENALGAHLRNK